jgi:hypothetical protein
MGRVKPEGRTRTRLDIRWEKLRHPLCFVDGDATRVTANSS